MSAEPARKVQVRLPLCLRVRMALRVQVESRVRLSFQSMGGLKPESKASLKLNCQVFLKPQMEPSGKWPSHRGTSRRLAPGASTRFLSTAEEVLAIEGIGLVPSDDMVSKDSG